MRIAYFGYDFFYGVLESILRAGHELIELYSFPTDNEYDFNDKVISLANKSKARITLSPVTSTDISRLGAEKVDVIVSAAYPFKIPTWQHNVRFAINIHPSPLPIGRGPWPLPWIIKNQLTESAVTIHEISEQWDRGDILVQDPFTVSKDDDLVTLSIRSQLAAARLAPTVLDSIDSLWANKTPQSEGSYWKMPTTDDRTINWGMSTHEALRIFRAFNTFEPFVFLNGKRFFVRKLHAWEEHHTLEPGTEIYQSSREKVYAVKDGFISLTQIEKAY
jgi:methionyl-tRNA formyltransferase